MRGLHGGWVACLGLTLVASVVHAEPAAPGEPEPTVPAPTAPAPSAKGEPAAAPTASEQARANSPVVSDGPVAVTTRLAPDPSNVGDVLVFEVVAAYPRDVRVNLPTRLNFEPLHHVQTDEGEPEPTGDGLRKTFRIELQHFEVGPAQIPAFPLTYVDADGGVHTVQVPARSFTVESLLVNEDDPQRRGEDPPISREYPDTTTEVVLWSALGTLLAALLGWLLLRRLWRRDREIMAPPPIPPHEVAFGALDELERGALLDEGQVQSYYVELTEIAKGYLEGRFGVPALDRTTDEIRLSLLRDSGRLAPLSADDVIAFLQECDLVKFARFEPPRRESEGALGQVREMVQSTMLEKAEPEKAEPEKAEPEKAEPEKAEPEKAEPETAEPERSGADENGSSSGEPASRVSDSGGER